MHYIKPRPGSEFTSKVRKDFNHAYYQQRLAQEAHEKALRNARLTDAGALNAASADNARLRKMLKSAGLDPDAA